MKSNEELYRKDDQIGEHKHESKLSEAVDKAWLVIVVRIVPVKFKFYVSFKKNSAFTSLVHPIWNVVNKSLRLRIVNLEGSVFGTIRTDSAL